MEYGYEFEYIQVDIRLDVLENSIASIVLSTDKTNNLWTWICIAAVVVFFFHFSLQKHETTSKSAPVMENPILLD